MGGIGADVFVFNAGDGYDVISQIDTANIGYYATIGYFVVEASAADFESGVDSIELQGFSTVNASNVMDFVSSFDDGTLYFEAEGTVIEFAGLQSGDVRADDFVFV